MSYLSSIGLSTESRMCPIRGSDKLEMVPRGHILEAIPLRPDETVVRVRTNWHLVSFGLGVSSLIAVVVLQFVGLQLRDRIGYSIVCGISGLMLMKYGYGRPTHNSYDMSAFSLHLLAWHDKLNKGSDPLMVSKKYISNRWEGREAHITMLGLRQLTAELTDLTVCLTLDEFSAAVSKFATEEDPSNSRRAFVVPAYDDGLGAGTDQHKMLVLAERQDGRTSMLIIHSTADRDDLKPDATGCVAKVNQALRKADLKNADYAISTHRLQWGGSGCDMHALHIAQCWLKHQDGDDVVVKQNRGTIDDPHEVQQLPAYMRGLDESLSANDGTYRSVEWRGQLVLRNMRVRHMILLAQWALVSQLIRARKASVDQQSAGQV